MADNEVLLLGDVHGSNGWLRVAARTAHALGITKILQLGDFGFWPHYASGKEFLDRGRDSMRRYGCEAWWVDGNHENHDWLDAQPHDEDGFWRLDNLIHIGRGARWEWAGRTFLGCGGAYSIDKPYRREGESWWAGETITEGDIERCGTEKVDVLVTHDAPWGTPNVIGPGTVGDKDDYPESAANRKRVAAIAQRTQPSLIVHGHYHHRNTALYEGARVEGLGRDGDALGSIAVLNLDDLSVTNVNPYVILANKPDTKPLPVDPSKSKEFKDAVELLVNNI